MIDIRNAIHHDARLRGTPLLLAELTAISAALAIYCLFLILRPSLDTWLQVQLVTAAGAMINYLFLAGLAWRRRDQALRDPKPLTMFGRAIFVLLALIPLAIPVVLGVQRTQSEPAKA
ncbi:MAG: hypothetical protein ACRDGS_08265 [Chloroflexota bacterium]